jgi:hypothetical protein
VKTPGSDSIVHQSLPDSAMVIISFVG